ncbi:UNVERIFIED_CONTAM: hypothetical protein FKN15_004565 [Acipenser sinensis]
MHATKRTNQKLGVFVNKNRSPQGASSTGNVKWFVNLKYNVCVEKIIDIVQRLKQSGSEMVNFYWIPHVTGTILSESRTRLAN